MSILIFHQVVTTSFPPNCLKYNTLYHCSTQLQYYTAAENYVILKIPTIISTQYYRVNSLHSLVVFLMSHGR